jgi:uncharacterized protein (TIGR02118 family)
MIRVSVFYPKAEGATFDHDYYRDSHVPLCASVWSPVKAEIDRGVNGPNVAAVHIVFESQEAVDAAMALPDTAKILADVANYTSITPVIQISEMIS